MRIRLRHGFRGKLTDEQHYIAGLYDTEHGVMSEKHATALIREGLASEVVPAKPAPARKQRTRKPKAVDNG